MIDLTDRCQGAMLGCAIGDALGAPVEMKTAAQIREMHGRIRGYVKTPARYTDDTEVALATAGSLLSCNGKVDVPHLASVLMAYWRKPRRPGYGPNTTKIMEALMAGMSCWEVASHVNPQGSAANGALLRALPVALVYRDATPTQIQNAVQDALRITHLHPDGIEAAYIFSRAIQHLLRYKIEQAYHLLAWLQKEARGEAIRKALRITWDGAALKMCDHEDFLDEIVQPNQWGRHFQIMAVDCLVCALRCFCMYQDHRALEEAVAMGGDTDSVAAVTGALVGAYGGVGVFPDYLTRDLEGREEILAVGAALAAISPR